MRLVKGVVQNRRVDLPFTLVVVPPGPTSDLVRGLPVIGPLRLVSQRVELSLLVRVFQEVVYRHVSSLESTRTLVPREIGLLKMLCYFRHITVDVTLNLLLSLGITLLILDLSDALQSHLPGSTGQQNGTARSALLKLLCHLGLARVGL